MNEFEAAAQPLINHIKQTQLLQRTEKNVKAIALQLIEAIPIALSKEPGLKAVLVEAAAELQLSKLNNKKPPVTRWQEVDK